MPYKGRKWLFKWWVNHPSGKFAIADLLIRKHQVSWNTFWKQQYQVIHFKNVNLYGALKYSVPDALICIVTKSSSSFAWFSVRTVATEALRFSNAGLSSCFVSGTRMRNVSIWDKLGDNSVPCCMVLTLQCFTFDNQLSKRQCLHIFTLWNRWYLLIFCKLQAFNCRKDFESRFFSGELSICLRHSKFHRDSDNLLTPASPSGRPETGRIFIVSKSLWQKSTTCHFFYYSASLLTSCKTCDICPKSLPSRSVVPKL